MPIKNIPNIGNDVKNKITVSERAPYLVDDDLLSEPKA
jgi:hypothetical protein